MAFESNREQSLFSTCLSVCLSVGPLPSDLRPSLTAIIRVREGPGARAVAQIAGRGQTSAPAVATVAAISAVGRRLCPSGRRGLGPAVQHLLRCHDQPELAVTAEVLGDKFRHLHNEIQKSKRSKSALPGNRRSQSTRTFPPRTPRSKCTPI